MMDAVIAWVDGSDPVHARKRAEALRGAGRGSGGDDNATYETRFADRGEIYWCIASILKYAPFIRRIFVVTDAQVPRYLADFAAEGLIPPDRIRVVDHREIFRDHLDRLPTFNSLTIESAIHRIEGLADTFLYFNDDFFLAAPVTAGDFVDPDGRLILRGRLRNVSYPLAKLHLKRLRRRLFADGHVSAHNKSANAQSARLLGLEDYLQIEHIPAILRRDTLTEVYDAHPDLFARQIAHRFRHIDQLLPVGLANHGEIARRSARIRPTGEIVYVKPGSMGDKSPDLARIARGDARFGCIQSLDEILEREPRNAADIVATMDDVFGAHMPNGARRAMARMLA